MHKAFLVGQLPCCEHEQPAAAPPQGNRYGQDCTRRASSPIPAASAGPSGGRTTGFMTRWMVHTVMGSKPPWGWTAWRGVMALPAFCAPSLESAGILQCMPCSGARVGPACLVDNHAHEERHAGTDPCLQTRGWTAAQAPGHACWDARDLEVDGDCMASHPGRHPRHSSNRSPGKQHSERASSWDKNSSVLCCQAPYLEPSTHREISHAWAGAPVRAVPVQLQHAAVKGCQRFMWGTSLQLCPRYPQARTCTQSCSVCV